jgi:hypothetical protein
MGGSILASSILCAVALPAKAEPVRKVIELFTSQGCNSCPPADRLAAQMAHEPGTVVISLPVDYWDYLGWKDSFASPAFTARQRAYSKARGDMQIYTPQAVIDGIAHAVGSERDAIEAAAAASRAPEVAITDTLNGDQLRIDVAAGPDAGKQAKVCLGRKRRHRPRRECRGDGPLHQCRTRAAQARRLGWRGAQVRCLGGRAAQARRRQRRRPAAGR